MSLSTAYGMKKRSKKKMAIGGEIFPDFAKEDEESQPSQSPKQSGGSNESDELFFKAYGGGGGMGKAHGGEVGDADMQDADMIARIVSKRREYSQGGMVANDTPPIADSMPNEFDDLVLRDDLEDTSDAGNEIGGPAEDTDVVSKIMSSRKKR